MRYQGPSDFWICNGNSHGCPVCGDTYTDADGGCYRCEEGWQCWLSRVLGAFSHRELCAIAVHDGVVEQTSGGGWDFPEGYRSWVAAAAEGCSPSVELAQEALLEALREAFRAAQEDAGIGVETLVEDVVVWWDVAERGFRGERVLRPG